MKAIVATMIIMRTTMIKIIMVMIIVIMMMIDIKCSDHSTLIHAWFLDLNFSKLTLDVVSI